MSRYATNTDLNNFYNQFTTKYYGTYLNDDSNLGTIFAAGQSNINKDLDRESSYIDAVLSGLGYKTPLDPLGASGTYDQQITEWCSKAVIYKRLVSEHAVDYPDELPSSIMIFGEDAKAIEASIFEGRLPLDIDITAEESGIGHVAIGATSGTCTFYNNRNYGGVYNGDYDTTYVIQIDSVAAGNDIGKATFKWSRDGGMNFEETGQDTGTQWIGIERGVKVRWQPGSHSGNQLEANDWWSFDVVSQSRQTRQYPDVITVKTFERG